MPQEQDILSELTPDNQQAGENDIPREELEAYLKDKVGTPELEIENRNPPLPASPPPGSTMATGKIHGMGRKEFETGKFDVTEEQAAAVPTKNVKGPDKSLLEEVATAGIGFGNEVVFGDDGFFGIARDTDKIVGGEVLGPFWRSFLNVTANTWNLAFEVAEWRSHGLLGTAVRYGWDKTIGGELPITPADMRIDIKKQLGPNPKPDAWGNITIPLKWINKEWTNIDLSVTELTEFMTSFMVPFIGVLSKINKARHGVAALAGARGAVTTGKKAKTKMARFKATGRVIGDAALAGAFADSVAWDPAKGNISNMLLEIGDSTDEEGNLLYPGLKDNKWLQMFSSKSYSENGQFLTARAMMVLEGFPLGVLADGLLRGLGFVGRSSQAFRARTVKEMGLSYDQIKALDQAGRRYVTANKAATDLLADGVPMSQIPLKLQEAGLGMDNILDEELIPAVSVLISHEFDVSLEAAEETVRLMMHGNADFTRIFIGGKNATAEIDIASNAVRTVDRNGVETIQALHQDKRIMGTERGERTTGVAKLNKRDSQLVDDAVSSHGLDEKTSNSIKSQIADSMARHPKSEWKPLEIASITQKVDKNGKLVVDDSGKAVLKVKYKQIPYTFHRNREGKAYAAGTPQRKRRVNTLGAKLEKEVLEIRARAAAGDEVAKTILGHANWYAVMRQRLGREWGVYRDLVGELLGALSPQTKVKANFANMTNVMHHYTRGTFDDLLEAYGKHRDGGGTYEQWVEAGNQIVGKDGLTDVGLKDMADEGFTKFGFNTRNTMDTLTGHWYNTRKGVRGKGVKAVNFAANLLGRDNQATIDVWAARGLERLSGRKPIPPKAEGSVPGNYIKGTDPTKDTAGSAMGFGQEVYENAARRLGMSPDDLQAVGWFMEKEQWTKKNWTNLDGEGGSFDLESDLIRPQRVVMGASVSRPDMPVVDVPIGAGREPLRITTQDPVKVEAAQTTARTIIGDDPTATAFSIGENHGIWAGEGEASLHIEITYSNTQKPAKAPQVDADGKPILDSKGKPKFKTVSETDQVPDFSSALRTAAQIGKDGGQDAVMISKVLNPTSEGNILKSNPNARPGVEVYFDDAVSLEEVGHILEFLKSRGLGAQTISEAERGATRAGGEKIIGIRTIYVPEFDDAASGLIGKTDEAIAHMERKFEEFYELSNELAELNLVARVQEEAFDTVTLRPDDYDRILSNDRTPTPIQPEETWPRSSWHETPEAPSGATGVRELDEGVPGTDRRSGEQRLQQDERGEALIDTESGVAFIRGLTSPDASTAVHELSHALHAQLLAGGDKKSLKIMEDAFGVIDGNWDKAAMERFADGMENFIANPHSMAEGQRESLGRLTAQIRDMYKDVKGSPIARDIDPQVAKFFGGLMSRTDLPIRYAPGKYMPAISWEAATARVKAGVAKGESIQDMIVEGDLLGTARMRDPKNLAEGKSGLRPGLDPERSEFGIKLDDPDEILKTAAAYGDLVRTLMDEDILPKLTDDQISRDAIKMYGRLAAAHDVPIEQQMAELLLLNQKNPGEAATKVWVANFMLQARLKTLQALGREVDSTGSVVAKARLQRAFIEYQYVAVMAQMKRTSAGQELYAWGLPKNLPTASELADAAKASDFLDSLGRDAGSIQDITNTIRGLDPGDLNDLGLLSEVVKNTNNQLGSKFRGVIQEIYTNWLLSGPSTYTGLAFGSPVLTMLAEGGGNLLGAAARGDVVMMSQILKNFVVNFGNMGHALNYALKTLKKGEGQLMPGRELNDSRYARRAVWTDAEPESFVGQAGKFILNHIIGDAMVRHPSRAIMTVDEFFRQMAGRTALAEKSYKDIMAQQMKLAVENGTISKNANRYEILAHKRKLHESVSEMVDTELHNTIKDGHLRNEQTLIHEAMNDPKLAAIPDDYDRAMAISNQVNSHMSTRHSELLAHVQDYATRPVFQGDLGPNQAAFQKILDQHTWGVGRIIIPFYRTPMNLMNRAFGLSPTTHLAEHAQKLQNLMGGRRPEFEQRLADHTEKLASKYGDDWAEKATPAEKSIHTKLTNALAKNKRSYGLPQDAELWRYHRKHMEDLQSGDPRRMAEARGRQATGMALVGLAWYWYENDMIQGAGPRDPDIRKIWEANGGMPYSYRFGNTRYQFRKMDPFATVLAIVADAFEVMEANPDMTEDEQADIMTTLIYATTKQLDEKMYIKSLTAITDMFADPDPESSKIRTWKKQFLGTLIPWNSLQRTMSYATDPIVRDTRRVIDNVRATTLWGGGEAPPKYSVLGELIYRHKPQDASWQIPFNVVSPVRMQSVSTDPLLQELERQNHPFRQPSSIRDGIDLRDVAGPEGYDWSVYHYQLSLVSQIKLPQGTQDQSIEWMTLRQTLEAYTQEGGKMHEWYIADGKIDPDPRTGITDQQAFIRDTISDFNGAAYDQAFDDSPELQLVMNQLDHDELKRDVPTAIEALGEGSPAVRRMTDEMKRLEMLGATP